ncbi:MAG TPA: type III PLP-dependent enzyme [Candidatus Sulfotelmatobacter sp.]|nr:type III PLP-dependent enzyme [Candidatus Sulfotelmatobacter sp.]
MSIPKLVTPYWSSNTEGELLVGGATISDLADRYGTPLFVYDQGVVERKYLALRNSLPGRFAISYSVKANPNPAFLRFFLDRGCGLEIASAGEFHLARSVDCPPEKIIFAGPGKTEAELRLVISEGIGEIHLESTLEIDRISAISRAAGHRTRVALRVNPNEESQGGAIRMGGKSAPFGVDEELIDPLILRISKDPHLEFCGIHLFSGTQVLDHTLLLDQYRKGFEIGRRAAALVSAPLQTLDLGGGLGIPYFPNDSELNLHQFGIGLLALLDHAREEVFANTQFVLEPGRFLVGETGVYVTRITDIKASRGKTYLIMDGGMNHHLAACGNLGQVIKRNFPMTIVNKLDLPDIDAVDVVGPLCTPLDTLGRAVHLPRAEVGDLLGIFQSGAYARTASPLGFLSHPSPPEVWVDDGCDFLIRRRGSTDDFVRDIQALGMPLRSNP